MTEEEFIETIDPCLSFGTAQEYEQAVRVGCSISDNAALMVGYLLASGSSHATLDLNLRLLDILKQERPTPIVIAAIPVVDALLKKQPATRDAISRLLGACREHSNAWNGLGIVECADENPEEECENIRSSWRKGVDS